MFWFGKIFGIVLLVALGFVILHFADKEKSLNLKIAGFLLVASGLVMAIAAVVLMFFGQGYGSHHGHGMHGHGMMRGGCNHHMDGLKSPVLDKETKTSPGTGK